MTDRERWTVYPLLFLALGITVKDKLVRSVDLETVRCNTLKVTDRGGKERVEISSNPAGGFIQFDGDRDVRRLFVGYVNNLAGMIFLDPQGKARPWVVIPTVGPHNALPNVPAELKATGPEPAIDPTPANPSPGTPQPEASAPGPEEKKQ